MNEDFKKANESLPAEEKEQLQKYQKKGITKITQSVDQESGEVLSTETTYSSEMKRKKGTFYVGNPEELTRLLSFNKNRAVNKMLVYIINTVNWNNEFSFEKNYIQSYGKGVNKFYEDRKYLLDNKFIFNKLGKKNVYTLNVELFSRGNAYVTSQLYEEQFGEELSQDSKLELAKIKKKVTKLSKEDIKKLIQDLEKML
jgi:hypothetical protein